MSIAAFLFFVIVLAFVMLAVPVLTVITFALAAFCSAGFVAAIILLFILSRLVIRRRREARVACAIDPHASAYGDVPALQFDKENR